MIYSEINRERENLHDRESIAFSTIVTRLPISSHKRSMIAINDQNEGIDDHDLLDRSMS